MTKITKAEFDALPESLKPKFKADGDDFSLVEEDVEGLKKSKAQILEEKKAIQTQFDEMKRRLDEIDTERAKVDEQKLKDAGEFAELEKKLREKITETETAAKQREAELLNNFKTERLKNELTARGVLADRAKYALADISEQVELVSGENGFNLKVKNGIGDAKEFDALIDGLKASSPFFFAAQNASGSGASGSQGGGGNAKTINRADFDKMPPTEQMAFIKDGGKPID